MTPETNPINYTVGGTVQAGNGSYLTRHADEELLQLCRERKFAYVLTARQMGKSSLMVRTAEQLQTENIRAVMIDLQQIGTQVTPEQWYLGLMAVVEEQLELETNVVEWWKQHDHLGFTQRLTKFFAEVLLREVSEPIVIFVDEIDTTLSLDFTDDFFVAIRYFYNARATTMEFNRLSFVLIGVATPGDLIRNRTRTPFNIGHRVDLTDFTSDEATPFADGFRLAPAEANRVLGWVMKWTNGHPYFTQRSCMALATDDRQRWTESDVDRVIADTFFGEMSDKDDNLLFVRDMLTKAERAPDVAGVLTTYRDVHAGKTAVHDEEQSLVKSHLKLSGIVRREGHDLHVRNRIYQTVFDQSWVNGHLPKADWRKRFKYAAAALLAVVLVSIPAILVYALKNNQLEKALVEADTQRNLAVSRELGANSSLQASFDPSLSLMLASLAINKADTSQAQDAARQFLLENRMQTALSGHSSFVNSAAYSPDGKFIVTASDDSTARVWNAATAQMVAELNGHWGAVLGAAYSPDGKFIVTASPGGTVRVWNAATAQMVAELKEHSSDVWSAAYSPDGKFIVTASNDGTARVWNAATAQMVAELKGHSSDVWSAAYSPDGKFIVTASKDHTARVWNAAAAQMVAELKGHSDNVSSAAYSPDGKFIVTASNDGTARVWNAAAAQMVAELKGHSDAVLSAAYSPDGKFIVTASNDRTVRVWNAATAQMVAELKGHSDAVLSAAYSPDGKFIVTASYDRTARVWNAATTQMVAELKGHSDNVRSAAYSPDGKFIVTASNDRTARVWNAATAQMVAELKGHSSDVRSAAYSPDGKFIVTASNDRTARVWNAATTQMVAELKGHSSDVRSAAYSPDGKFIVTASSDGTARVWNAATAQMVAELKGHSSDVWSAAYSPDGKFIVTASFDRTARVWNAATAQMVAELNGHWGAVLGAAYSPDGKFIVTASPGGTARVWNAATAQMVAELKGHSAAINSAAYSPDGQFIVTASADGTARIYPRVMFMPVEELKEWLSRLAPRELTPAERERYLHEPQSRQTTKSR